MAIAVTDKPDLRILVTGGGTGGHVSPALAVIQAIRGMAEDLDRRPVFRYLGSLHGVERELATEAGIEFFGVQTGKLRRARRWWGVVSRKNMADAFRVPVGIAQAFGEVRRFKPDVVLATGGYVSVPPVIAAGLSGIPVLIHEQTVQIGLANRIAARFASKIALTFDGSVADLPKSARRKAFVTGNPVRSVIFGGDAARAVVRCGFVDDGLPVVYVTGGAQGARSINRAVASALPALLGVTRVIHQCGRQPESETQDFDMLKDAAVALPGELQKRYFVVPFVKEEIGDIYAVSKLLICRSGAGTVAEACALGIPSILVPLVPTGGDEQTRNAKRLVDAGAAVTIRSADLTGQLLVEKVKELLADTGRLESMSKSARSLATPNSAHDLAVALLELASPRIR
jgi:UDP-N-acetylglucosamine--N-acetylmuramyl-(pentapeptide) pyrophosphoryl-undecaprenol N-acetylglucosamine transferase